MFAPFDQVPKSAQRLRHYSRGEMIFAQGDLTRGLYYVVEGVVTLKRYTQQGQGVVIHRARAHGVFAEASLFSDRYHCHAIAEENSRVLEFDRATLINMFASNSHFAMAMAGQFAHQLQQQRRRMELLSIKRADERIYNAMIAGDWEGNVMALAAQVGLSHEATYRGLAALVKKGLIVKVGRGAYRVA